LQRELMETSRGTPGTRADKPERLPIRVFVPPPPGDSGAFGLTDFVFERVEKCKEIETWHLMSR